MKKSYITLVLKSAAGIVVILGVWHLVKCCSVNFKALTPAGLRDYIQSFGRFSIAVYITAYVLNTISIVPPIAALSLAAGLIFGEVKGGLYLMISAMLGTSATFMISRYFGRNLIEKMLKGKFKELDERLAKSGFMTILFFRLIPLVPYEVLNYAGGLSRIRFKDYFLATFLGLIPGVIIAAFFGGSLGEVKIVKDLFAPKFLVAAGFMVLVIAIPFIYKRLKDTKI